MLITTRLLSVVLLILPVLLQAAPKFDVHLHYKWNQQEITSPQDVIVVLDANEIEYAAIIGTPAELVQELRKQNPERILAWYGPYREHGDWYQWHQDKTLPERARKALTSGDYIGVGELHLVGGFSPTPTSEVITGLLRLSAETQTPMLIHVEFGRADYLIELCRIEPDAHLLLAHAGAPLRPREVRRALEACPNLWWELSARDPLRYTGSPIVDEDGVLKPKWKALILDYSDRLMLGADAVWPVEQLNPWDEPDSGWQHLGEFWEGHEQWLSQLPDDVRQKIEYLNAVIFFGIPG
ncbi:hypothetical protein BOV90_02980 [Solemya velum gill symbiont]|uniref:Amidohydrolase-related domain-containing protein n=2 Tax=Solemya velum gill symbiont TaxID=2340 RepID=A0A1T2DH16_SOVGS|nr:amidohydrolase family protein [Solemya velum gill symbiont]OOY34324.1 hypothetical protein BOV88_10590 [Solemya velum gill symbiont]OOY36974.1 hypothetical protein BOV89_09750 [Solemya velum gill symbiont]OOY40675.1 hypothetical protein BOV90_02980 [Solemya velum gill symbiont]OOY44180.1 hypothetical protein BOV91_02070 [Solemya velum gill symbiont]OOY44694.1 hypothetical protein BOV92_08085 [Solemya velum gill symbiont]